MSVVYVCVLYVVGREVSGLPHSHQKVSLSLNFGKSIVLCKLLLAQLHLQRSTPHPPLHAFLGVET